MTTMLSLPTFKEILTTQIQEQINLRRRMISEMVGSLYPGILADEIVALNEMREKLK